VVLCGVFRPSFVFFVVGYCGVIRLGCGVVGCVFCRIVVLSVFVVFLAFDLARMLSLGSHLSLRFPTPSDKLASFVDTFSISAALYSP